MAITTNTEVVRISLSTPNLDLGKTIKEKCDILAAMDDAKRLAAAIESHNELVLIFQSSGQ